MSREPLWDSQDVITGIHTIPDAQQPQPRSAARYNELSAEEHHREHDESIVVPKFRVLEDGKEVLDTSMLDGTPEGIVHASTDTLWPLALSLALTWLFAGLLFKSPLFSATGALVVLAAIAGWQWPKAEFFA